MASNRISVIIDVATRQAESALKNFTNGIKEADGAQAKMKAGFTGGMDAIKSSALVGGAALGMFVTGAGQAITAASNLSESTNAVNVAFDDAAEAVHELGENSVDSMGLSTRAFNEAAVGMSAFAKTAAGEGGNVTRTLQDLMVRATDFASVMNMDVNQAMDIFRSSLSGEAEPIKRFGIDMSAAAVEAYALSAGLVESKSQMTESIKVQARYGLLLEKTNAMAGDFAKTSDGLANSQRKLNANIENLQAELGKNLLPVMEDVVGGAITLFDAWKALGNLPPVKLVLEITGQDSLFGGLKTLLDQAVGIPGLTHVTDQLSSAWWKFNNATDSATGSIGDITTATEKSTSATRYSTDAAEDYNKAVQDGREAHERSAAAIRDRQQALEDIEEAERGAQSASLSYRQQVADTAKAVAEATLIQLDSKRTDEERAQAARDAEAAVLAQADAALQFAEDQAAANGEVLSAKDKTRIYVEELYALTSTLSGPVRAELEAHIQRLLNIPKSIYTNVGTIRSGDIAPMVTGRRASGGPVSPGGTYLVGEQGPELLQMGSTSGNVVNAAQTSAALAGGGSPSVFNVTINADPNPDVTVRKLREWVRRNGPIQGLT